MTRRTIDITQELHRHDPGHFSVIVTVIDEGVTLSKEYSYFLSNKAYPIFKSLIATLRDYENVDVKLKTATRFIASEINSVHDSKGTLASMLAELLTKNNISIKAE